MNRKKNEKIKKGQAVSYEKELASHYNVKLAYKLINSQEQSKNKHNN